MKSKSMKKQEAAERQARYDALSLAERLARANAAPGESHRERARIAQSMRAAA